MKIRMKYNDSILLQASNDQVQKVDGNYYIHPALIDMNRFQISDRIYLCPAKGKSVWVDLKTETGWMNDICWIYPEPKKKYQHIAGWYGFYPTHRQYEIEL